MNSSSALPIPAKKLRRWWRLRMSLRTALIMMTLLGVLFGIVGRQVAEMKRRRVLVERLLKADCRVDRFDSDFSFSFGPEDDPFAEPESTLFGIRPILRELAYRPGGVRGPMTRETLAAVSELGTIEHWQVTSVSKDVNENVIAQFGDTLKLHRLSLEFYVNERDLDYPFAVEVLARFHGVASMHLYVDEIDLSMARTIVEMPNLSHLGFNNLLGDDTADVLVGLKPTTNVQLHLTDASPQALRSVLDWQANLVTQSFGFVENAVDDRILESLARLKRINQLNCHSAITAEAWPTALQVDELLLNGSKGESTIDSIPPKFLASLLQANPKLIQEICFAGWNLTETRLEEIDWNQFGECEKILSSDLERAFYGCCSCIEITPVYRYDIEFQRCRMSESSVRTLLGSCARRFRIDAEGTQLTHDELRRLVEEFGPTWFKNLPKEIDSRGIKERTFEELFQGKENPFEFK